MAIEYRMLTEAFGKRRAGADLRASAAAGLGARRRRSPHAGRHKQHPPHTGRLRRKRPLNLHRTPRTTGARRRRGRVMMRDGRRQPPSPSCGRGVSATPLDKGRLARSPRESRSREPTRLRGRRWRSCSITDSTAGGSCRGSPAQSAVGRGVRLAEDARQLR